MSADTVSPISLAMRAASSHAAAADADMAGVIPVKWNQSLPSKTRRQSTSPGSISAIEDAARSYTTLDARMAAPFSR